MRAGKLALGEQLGGRIRTLDRFSDCAHVPAWRDIDSQIEVAVLKQKLLDEAAFRDHAGLKGNSVTRT